MSPTQLLHRWVEIFNQADADALADLYHEDAVNFQVNFKPIEGREAIRQKFSEEFATAEDGLHHRADPGMRRVGAYSNGRTPGTGRGCGFFHIEDGKIRYQRILGICSAFTTA